MSYFTERHGLRKPIERTYDISVEMYSLLFQCCEKYLSNLASMLPDECPDGRGCCGVDYKQLNVRLKFEIPDLYRDSYNNVAIPEKRDYGYGKAPKYDQFALLDYIEFIAQNMKDVEQTDFHSYFSHYHLNLLETNRVFSDFKREINDIFNKTGLLYALTDEKRVERVVENSPLTQEIKEQIEDLKEYDLQALLNEAIALFKAPHPNANKLGVEKMWDALENLKVYFTNSKKKQVDQKVSDLISGQNEQVARIFEKELSELGNIGNNYHIRHYNDKQVVVTDTRHYDYFFNRCLSLIALAIQYLQ